ncbi:hypothetical protein E2562_013231 [Oryza meyeriana var. granulata]|uniref:SKP1 component dimerisation domain-containing protein n=1 Tax=Oryza meyeriana var. granulata TaxID=110450 RepID=A0A6G1D517_9ORYZ|nr:hypothetical protein E2562_013231 [Oryza meyeriana var. granulata]
MEEGKGEKPVAAAAVEKKGVFAGVWEAVQRAPAADAGKREEESGRMITLQSSDGKLAKVTEASARLSKFIAKMIDDNCADPYVPLPNVDYKTLVADTIKGKTPEEIRTAFNIENDLTDQDKEEILQENARAFEVYKPVPGAATAATMSIAETGDWVAADFGEDGVPPFAGVDPDPGSGAATWMQICEMAKYHTIKQF